ncbi:MAG: lipoate--protein ligase family protein, partial [Candidatus Hydrogenedentes bacterium]|nr:lipoate--protein ligase family protein [Candidatus Hydrogenedentota bacterium]
SASHKGTSDLAVAGRKISGNAQRRRKHFILHHGTLLYDMGPELMERYLIEPGDRPQYRGERTHRGFVKCLPLTSNEIRETFLRAFAAPGTTPDKPTKTELTAVKALTKERFATPEWINRR